MVNSDRVVKNGVDRVIGTKIGFTVIILIFAISISPLLSLLLFFSRQFPNGSFPPL